MELNKFFKKNRVDDYSVVAVSRILPPEGFHPSDLLPSCRTVIVFAKAIPQFVFETESKVKSSYLFQLIRYMDAVGFQLSDKLFSEGQQSVPIPAFFPAKIRDGKIKGVLSLKHYAAAAHMGTIGLNTLLISETFGNRLCLSAVLTNELFDCEKSSPIKELCFRCHKCQEACPTRAIGENGVAFTKCLNFTYPIPVPIRPVFNRMLKWQSTQKYAEIILNTIGWNTDMICSKCLTACPYYHRHRDSILKSDNHSNAGELSSRASVECDPMKLKEKS